MEILKILILEKFFKSLIFVNKIVYFWTKTHRKSYVFQIPCMCICKGVNVQFLLQQEIYVLTYSVNGKPSLPYDVTAHACTS